MGYEHQSCALLAVQVKHQLHDLLAGRKVQAAGGLVGQQNRWVYDKGAGQGHALLLATAKHLGVRRQPLRQADAGQHVSGCLSRVLAGCQLQRQHDVFQRRQVAQQLKALEHKAHLAGAQAGPVIFVHRKQIGTCQMHRAGGGCIQTGDDRQQRALARTRCADYRSGLAGFERKIDIAQNLQRAGGIGHRLANVLNRNNDIFTHGTLFGS